jgi:hypothetical protein
MTRLSIPPDHPLATELFDLISLQVVLIKQINSETAKVNAGGDRTLLERSFTAMDMVNKEIESVREEYRRARCADDTCSVGLTYVHNRPIVDGRTCGLMVH